VHRNKFLFIVSEVIVIWNRKAVLIPEKSILLVHFIVDFRLIQREIQISCRLNLLKLLSYTIHRHIQVQLARLSWKRLILLSVHPILLVV